MYLAQYVPVLAVYSTQRSLPGFVPSPPPFLTPPRYLIRNRPRKQRNLRCWVSLHLIRNGQRYRATSQLPCLAVCRSTLSTLHTSRGRSHCVPCLAPPLVTTLPNTAEIHPGIWRPCTTLTQPPTGLEAVMSAARFTTSMRAVLPSKSVSARSFVVKAGLAPALRTNPRRAAAPSRTLLLSKRRGEPSVAPRPAAWHGGGISTGSPQPLWRNQSGPVGAGAGGLEQSQSSAPAEVATPPTPRRVPSACRPRMWGGAAQPAGSPAA